MRRGDLVTIALQGDFGKQRPALIVQADRFAGIATTTVLPLSSAVVDAPLVRVMVEPSPSNGLRKRSQVMVDKATTVQNDRIGQIVGRLEDAQMVAVNRALALFLGFA